MHGVDASLCALWRPSLEARSQASRLYVLRWWRESGGQEVAVDGHNSGITCGVSRHAVDGHSSGITCGVSRHAVPQTAGKAPAGTEMENVALEVTEFESGFRFFLPWNLGSYSTPLSLSLCI